MNRERVLRAAIALADEVGIEALSMRRLAQSLGVEAMSLYNHVKGKDELLDGMTDLVAAEIALPTVGGDWKAEMQRRARSAHEVLLEHPWAAQRFVSGLNVGPGMLRYIDATIGCLRAAGFSLAMADHAWNAIDAHVYGFTLQELNFPLQKAEYVEAAEGFLPELPPETYPHMRALTEEVISGRHSGVHDFDFGLELILEGLERRLRRRWPFNAGE